MAAASGAAGVALGAAVGAFATVAAGWAALGEAGAQQLSWAALASASAGLLAFLQTRKQAIGPPRAHHRRGDDGFHRRPSDHVLAGTPSGRMELFQLPADIVDFTGSLDRD